MAYSDFKSYIQDNYKEVLKSQIFKFVNENHDAHGFHSINVLSLCEQKVDNVEVKTMLCHDDIGPYITMDIHCAADIVMMGLGKSEYEASRKTRWFTVYVRAILKNGLHDFTPQYVEEYGPGKFEIEGALDEYLVPYISTSMLEEEAQDLYDFYCKDAIFKEGWMLPIDDILTNMGIEYFEADLPDNEFGRMYFREAEEEVHVSYMLTPKHKYEGKEKRKLNPGTMLINPKKCFMGDFGWGLNTIAHELVHWDKHQKFFEVLALLNDDEVKLSCEVMPELSSSNLDGVKKAVWWAEWQANALASRICMPRDVFCGLLEQCYEEELRTPHKCSTGEILERALVRVANCFSVSDYAAKVRALQLGYKQAEGTLLYRDAVFQQCYWFNSDALGDNETFRINYAGYKAIYDSDEEFRKLIDSGRFVFTGALVCINDPLYVINDSDELNYYGYILTDYATEHVDECCLKFKKQYNFDDSADDFYSLCYLCKHVDASTYTESKTIVYEDNQDVLEQEKELKAIDDAGEEIMNILGNLPSSPQGTLDAHIKRLKKEDGTKLTNEELQFRTGISERTIREYRKLGSTMDRYYVYALCIGLHLHPLFSDDLIRKAFGGYTYDKEGFFASALLHNHFGESLKLINRKLKKQGYKTWGVDEKILDPE